MNYGSSILVISVCLLLLLNSCKKEFVEGFDSDDKRPTDVSLDALLASAEIYTVYVTSGELARTSNLVMQQMMDVDRLCFSSDSYIFPVSEFDTVWELNAYAGSMKDLAILMRKAKEDDAPHYLGAAQILMALNLSTLSDAFGDIPYSEALAGSVDAGLEPSYDSQREIYNSIISLLTDGIQNVSSESSVLSLQEEEFFFNGDMVMWAKFGNTLLARAYNRISNTEVYDVNATLTALENGFDADEGCLPTFGSEQSQANPWGRFLVERDGYLQFEGTMIDSMEVKNDTLRMSVFQDLEGFYFQYSSPVVIAHGYEMLFIEAESMLKMGSSDLDIQAKLEEAVSAHFLMLGLDASSYLSNDLVDITSLTTDEEKLGAIIWEKYVAGYTTNEGWADYRRTGFPALNPPMFTPGDIDIPERLPYPKSEYLYNSNTPLEVQYFPASLTTPVWWAAQ